MAGAWGARRNQILMGDGVMAMRKNSWRRSALAVLMIFGLVSVSGPTLAAQEQENPWWVDRWEVAPDWDGHAEILEVRPNGRVSFEFPMTRFYGLAEHDFVVIANEDLLSLCIGEIEKSQELVTYRAGGKFVTKTPPGGIELPTYVYATGGDIDGLDFMFAACDAWADDGIAPPAPTYSGFTTLRVNSNPDIPLWASFDQPAGFYRNGLQGVVSDSDGNMFDLSTFTSFPLTGLEQGPPAFVRHEVSVTPAVG